MPDGKASWGIIGIGQSGASLAEGICRSGAPVTLFLSPCGESRVRELAAQFPVVIDADNQTIIDDADHVILAARRGTFTGIGLDPLRERGALEAWSDACQSVLDAWQERER